MQVLQKPNSLNPEFFFFNRVVQFIFKAVVDACLQTTQGGNSFLSHEPLRAHRSSPFTKATVFVSLISYWKKEQDAGGCCELGKLDIRALDGFQRVSGFREG